MGSKNDKIILNLKKEIETKKLNLSKIDKFKPVTNCNLDLDNSRINIHVAGKETLLYLIAKINSLKKSLSEVMPEQTLIICGYTADEWIKDLVNKFNILNINEEEKRLQKLEAKLHDLLSVDTKIELEIDDIKKQI